MQLQLDLFDTLNYVDYSKRIMIGLSGGINSAAALLYLIHNVEDKPKDIYLYYSHLVEHSPDTKKFVLDLVEYAKKHFENVIFETSDNSMSEYCRDGFKGIPHPKRSPCTKFLKLVYMVEFMEKYKIDLDIVGYVRDEYSRIKRQIERGVKNKDYLISHLSNEDCFKIVKKYLGWFPEIYSIKWKDKRIGAALKKWGHELAPNQYGILRDYHSKGYNYRAKSYRVFKHNNCLPCKNMHQWEIFLVKVFFPNYYEIAKDLEKELGSYWGRSSQIVDNNSDCAICAI